MSDTDDVVSALPSLPDPSDGGLAVWAPVSTRELLFDRVMAGGTDAIDRLGSMEPLGRFLAGVHSIHVSDALAVLPRRDQTPAWLSAAPSVARTVRVVRQHLLHNAAGHLLFELCAREHLGDDALVLVHGRFSTSMVVPDGGYVVLGWREAGLGLAMRDFGFLIGELVEAAIVTNMTDTTGPMPRRILSAIAELRMGYERGRGHELSVDEKTGLASFAASRVLDHMAIHVATLGRLEGPRALLRRADAQLAAMMRLLGFTDLSEGPLGGMDA